MNDYRFTTWRTSTSSSPSTGQTPSRSAPPGASSLPTIVMRPSRKGPRRRRLPPVAPDPAEHPPAEPMRGIAARIAENMQDSLAVPTATSTRVIPVKLLEENRRLINQFTRRRTSAGPRISFTHLIAWAVTRALELHHRDERRLRGACRHAPPAAARAINLGLAIDIERRGERVLLVPNIKDAAGWISRRWSRLQRPGRSRAGEQTGDRLTSRTHDRHADQSRHDRHRHVGAAADGRSGHHRRHRQHRLPRGVQGRRARR